MEKQQTSNEYGMSQELLFLSELVNYGLVSIPYGNSGRYDCILDIEGDLYKIQIKSVNQIDENTIMIPFRNNRMSASGPVSKVYTSDEVDFIGIIYNNNIYLFPTKIGTKSLTVKIHNDNLKSNQHYLEDFQANKILKIDLKTWVKLKETTRQSKGMNIHGPKYSCCNCGSPVWEKDSLCITCAQLQRRQVERPSREELKGLIRNTPFTQIGAKFNVTDNSIRKWCKNYGLPFRVKDIKEYTDEQWGEL